MTDKNETILDISGEAFRFYTYADGRRFTIANPVKIHIITDDKGTTHRVIDANGVTHRPERNWVGISWSPNAGEAAFIA